MTPVLDASGFDAAAYLILQDLRDRVGMGTWFVSRRDGEHQVFISVVDDEMGIAAGDARPWQNSFCSRMIEGRAPMAAPDVALVPAFVEARRINGLPAGACVSVPITAPDGQMLGTLCGLATSAKPQLESAMPIIHAQAQILGVMLSHELRIAQEVRRAERDERSAHRDDLTALGDRLAWDAALSREEGRAARYGSTASIAVLNLDGFRNLNEQWGHEAGDQILTRTAREIASRLRGTDVAARLSGDEFGILLPHTTSDQAQDVVDDILDRLGKRGIAVSGGVAQRPPGGRLAETWKRAYEVLRTGRQHATDQSPRTGRVRPDVTGATSLPSMITNVDAVLNLLKNQLGVDVAFVNRFDGAEREFRNLVTSIDVPISAGTVEPREGSYCQMIVDGTIAEVVPDTSKDPALRDLPITADLHIGSYLGVPLHTADGGLYGTLCAYSTTPQQGLTDRDAQVLRGVADVIMRLVEAEDTRDAQRHLFLRQMDKLAAQGGPTAVYQPIHSLQDLTVIGFEALSRFPSDSLPPVEWFTSASSYGVGGDLELSAMRSAISVLPAIDGFLSLNVSPATMLTPQFSRLIASLPLPRIVLEITEHEVVEDYDIMNAILRPLRENGLRVAVDDAGAGFASMQHILAVMPDFIKLDISLVRGIDRDPARQALAASLAAFGFKTNAALIAEGVETVNELTCLRDLNIEYGQGYHLSRPDPQPRAPRSSDAEPRDTSTSS